MSDRRVRTTEQAAAKDPERETPAIPGRRSMRPSAMAERLVRPHSREEAEQRYAAARDAWIAAMRAGSSGRPSDLAALAVAQQAYEAALAERQRWISSPTVAIPIEADRPTGIDAVVGQELSWRRVKAQEQEKGRVTARRRLLGRLFRR